MKKVVLKLFAICFAIVVSSQVFAYDFEKDGIYYNINGSNVSVTYEEYSGGNSYSGNVVIPSTVTYEGTTYNVTVIGGNNAFHTCPDLTSVTIPNSVTEIEWAAFSGCPNLTSVTIPNSVTTIGSSAFSETGLESVIIPESITTINWHAFSHNPNLKNVTIPNSVTEIHHYAFSYCPALKNIAIPNSVTLINYFAFKECKNLQVVKIGNGVTIIRGEAFVGCTSIDTLYCMAPSVPTFETGEGVGDMFKDINKSKITLYVPCNKKTEYEAATYWSGFGTIKEWCLEIDPLDMPFIETEVTTLDATEITKNSAKLSATVETNGELSAKGFQYKMSMGGAYATVNVMTETFAYNLTGLGADIRYTFRAFAVVGADTTFGEEKTFVTLDDSGIEDVANENTISIYPNPAKDFITIEGKGEVVITNSIGQVVKEIKDNYTYRTIDIKDFESGVYYIKVGNATQKLVIE